MNKCINCRKTIRKADSYCPSCGVYQKGYKRHVYQGQKGATMTDLYDEMLAHVKAIRKLARDEYDNVREHNGPSGMWVPMDFICGQCTRIEGYLDMYADACSDHDKGTSGEPERDK